MRSCLRRPEKLWTPRSRAIAFRSGIAFSFSSERFMLGPVPVGTAIWISSRGSTGGGTPRSGPGRRGKGRRGWRGGGGVLTAVNRSLWSAVWRGPSEDGGSGGVPLSLPIYSTSHQWLSTKTARAYWARLPPPGADRGRVRPPGSEPHRDQRPPPEALQPLVEALLDLPLEEDVTGLLASVREHLGGQPLPVL